MNCSKILFFTLPDKERFIDLWHHNYRQSGQNPVNILIPVCKLINFNNKLWQIFINERYSISCCSKDIK